MDTDDTRDRLAVRDYDRYGEQVADGNWLVSDAQRAAAGRETVAARFRALLPANREHAAARYAAGGWPDGEEVVRVWTPRDPAALSARLGGQPLTAWADGDVLHVLWRGEAAQARMAGGIQLPLWPVEETAGLWEASVRVRRLDEAVITGFVSATGETDPLLGPGAGEPVTYRGDRAPVWTADEPLAGTLEQHSLPSAALGAPRGGSVYLPPQAASGPLPGGVLADGASVSSFAPALETAV